MDWQQPIDLYCERFGPGLFAEPLNAVSNLAFILAGLWLVSALPHHFPRRRTPASYELLAGLLMLIGICSAAFHTFALRWAELLDVLSIALFIHAFVICFAHHVLDVRWRFAWIASPVFWAFGTLISGPIDPTAFNGSVAYLPAFAGLALMGLGLALNRRPGASQFLLATLVFAVALSFRSVDLAWCADWVWGTHWAWHLLNGLTLTLAMLGLARARERRHVPVGP